MQKLRFSMVMAMLVMMGLPWGGAFAQSALEGPLQAPETAVQPAAKPAKKAQREKAKHKKVAHRNPSSDARASESFAVDGSTPKRDVALPNAGTAADPLSFGMKWNGNSDNARETRIQNYDANASGSGAEVGMKLHF